ncbi:riboflavin biosynthesis protein Rib7, partial [Bombardia bombarda]
LPHHHNDSRQAPPPPPPRPFVTLTFATSLDSSLALAPGVRTILSGPQSKAMTHFLRSRHAAICVGVGTALADDPGLNCRLSSTSGGTQHQPRPIVIDPHARWAITEDAKVLQLARAGQGLAPIIVVAEGTEPPAERRALLERHGGRFLFVEARADGGGGGRRFGWEDVLAAVAAEGLESIMIEGGGQIINSLLTPPDSGLIDSVIVTIAPTWLGQGGVVVSPARATANAASLRLTGVEWHPLGEDVVLCGRISR